MVQQQCYTSNVPTAYPRIALTRDPELDRALKLGASVLGSSKPTASVARELILRGANSGDDLDRWLTEQGAAPAARPTSDLLEAAAGLGPYDPGDPRPLSDALAEIRAEEDR
jgi:hypothetical protein